MFSPSSRSLAENNWLLDTGAERKGPCCRENSRPVEADKIPSTFHTTMMDRKYLTTIANDVIHRCSLVLETSVEILIDEFEAGWNPKRDSDYSRNLVEFCSSKALNVSCSGIQEKINDGSFSRLTFDMMVAWEMPSSEDEEAKECVAKENEEKKDQLEVNKELDEIPLFYSDIMPLLVDNNSSVGEDSFVWLATMVPLIADVVNGRFTFETLTATTGLRLHFPAYDKFLKEIDRCVKHLQKQATPTGVELADDEYILHVEGTAGSQRVVRHIGSTSWPGRLTLSNYCLYFEASGVISYEAALTLDLSKNSKQTVKPSATGPWGAPLFDNAIIYESSESLRREEGVVLEFPEITSSTRRDHWLALIKEIILMHRFLSKYKVESPIQAWEVHARTTLGIVRLHAAREMLRISPPEPRKFLIFSLFDELPKGDLVLGELAESLKNVNSGHSRSASTILRNLTMSQTNVIEVQEKFEETLSSKPKNISSLESAIHQVREEAKEIGIAKATTEELKEEGISGSVQVFIELLRPLKGSVSWFQQVVSWERPINTLMVIVAALLVTYREWIGNAIASCLLVIVWNMIKAKRERIGERFQEMVVCTASDQTTVESIVSAQHGLQMVHDLVQKTNIAILKIKSILLYKSPKHANMVVVAVTGAAVLLTAVPFKFIIMASILCYFGMTSKLAQYFDQDPGNRRLHEWWDSIPVIPIKLVEKLPEE